MSSCWRAKAVTYFCRFPSQRWQRMDHAVFCLPQMGHGFLAEALPPSPLFEVAMPVSYQLIEHLSRVGLVH